MIPVSTFSFDQLSALAANRAICDYLRVAHPSAHSDLGTYLFRTASGLDYAYFSPNIKQCLYVVLHNPRGIIFAGAFGMKALGFCLPPDKCADALAEGGKQFEELLGWIEFDPFRPHVKSSVRDERMARWCHVAYENAGAMKLGREV